MRSDPRTSEETRKKNTSEPVSEAIDCPETFIQQNCNPENKDQAKDISVSKESLATEQRLDPEISALVNFAFPNEELDKIPTG